MKIEDLPRPANYRRQMAKNGGYEMVPAYTAEEVLGIVAAQWQPIETAPKDGTLIIGFWSPRAGFPVHSGCYGFAVFESHNWCNPEDSDDDYIEPTYWMFAPKAP